MAEKETGGFISEGNAGEKDRRRRKRERDRERDRRRRGDRFDRASRRHHRD